MEASVMRDGEDGASDGDSPLERRSCSILGRVEREGGERTLSLARSGRHSLTSANAWRDVQCTAWRD